MKKTIVKLLIAGSVSAVLFGCGSTNEKPSEETTVAKVSEENNTAAESVAAEDVGNITISDTKGSDDEEGMEEDQLPVANLENGTVKEIKNGFIRIDKTGADLQGSSSSEGADELDLTMHSNGFYVVDMETGKASTELKQGDEIFAWVAQEYSMSLPPQVNVHVILTNVKEENKTNVPAYTDSIESVEETDEGIVLKDSGNNIEWVLDKSVKPTIISTDGEVEFSSIEKGDKCLIWADSFILSGKSETTTKVKAKKVVILK